ncbi:MAG: methyltransferase domain-containing protein, partial [Propionicimonas sp.]|nr:methyltransferase domain-containing protein [Propionicimonas sp.]
VAACRERNPGVRVAAGAAEALPFGDGEFDLVAAQLVLHFVSDPARVAAEMRRVGRPGARVAAAVWDFGHGMQMLRAFWDAAVSLDPAAPDELRAMRFGREGEIAQWLTDAGLEAVTETTLEVSTPYVDFEELWNGFLAGVGPAGSYCVWLPPAHQERLRRALFERLGEPSGPFELSAVARAGRGTST